MRLGKACTGRRREGKRDDMNRCLRVTGLLVWAPFLLGWDHVLSADAFFSVNPWVSYSQVAADPQAYRGTTLMLAGQIVDHAINREGSTVEVLCYTRDRDDKPEELDESCGRFLARTVQVLDPEAFKPGRLVTLAGVVSGHAERPVGEGTGVYPVFEIEEIYLWPSPAQTRWGYWPRCYDPFCDPFYSCYRGPGYWCW